MLFTEDFEQGLELWEFPEGGGHALVRAEGPEHGTVLSMQTEARQAHAIIRGSEHWNNVRVEGEVLFPQDVHNYLGFIYGYFDDGRRLDFGSLYIKGNDSYLQANPHFDTNVGRTLYPERRVSLTDRAAIEIDTWQRFALEVVDNEAHLYVGDVDLPQLTLHLPGPRRGAFGFKPRNPGGEVRIDNIVARTISEFTHKGPPQPDIPYDRNKFVTDWRVMGPLAQISTELEAGPFDPNRVVHDDGRSVTWRAFPADDRGAVLTGRVTEYRKGRRVAYFHTVIGDGLGRGDTPEHDRPSLEAVLGFSTVDPLAIWLNGEFLGFAPGDSDAWWDAEDNPRHSPVRVRVTLRQGGNDLVVRAIGGVYATGGFYLRVRRVPAKASTS